MKDKEESGRIRKDLEGWSRRIRKDDQKGSGRMIKKDQEGAGRMIKKDQEGAEGSGKSRKHQKGSGRIRKDDQEGSERTRMEQERWRRIRKDEEGFNHNICNLFIIYNLNWIWILFTFNYSVEYSSEVITFIQFCENFYLAILLRISWSCV